MQQLFPVDLDIEDDEDTVIPIVRSEITAPAPAPRHDGARHLLGGEEWTWEQLRDYVKSKIAETTNAHYSSDPVREPAIFKGFINRYGGQVARRIALYAFDGQSEPGWWKGSPITPTRFCKGSDRYFSAEIVQKLNAAV